MKPEYPTPRHIMGEAVEKLRGIRRTVYFLTIRDGKPPAEAAEVLGIGVSEVMAYQDEAIKLVERYCKEAIAKGRI